MAVTVVCSAAVGGCVGTVVVSGPTSREEVQPDVPTKSNRHARTAMSIR